MISNQDTNFRIVLIGAGNLAWHLGHIFFEKGITISRVISQSLDSARNLAVEINASFSNSLKELPSDADFIIVAVNDSSLSDVLESIATTHSVVVHTSGTMDLTVFGVKFKRYGVLYPFQTFTRGIEVKIKEFPVCIEGSDGVTLEMIGKLAVQLSNDIRILSTEQRRLLHLCGVLTNNFTNHLISRATDLMNRHNLDSHLLMPLLHETVSKLEITTAFKAQTGPARRKNLNIIEKHLEMLTDNPELKKLYSSLTDSIIAYYSK